ncbi:hypothetical protein D3C77_804730 [compost metagenome]
MEVYLQAALQNLKRLENDTTNVSLGTAMGIIGMFISHDLEVVIRLLETALIEAEQTKTPPAATEDVG